MCFCSAYIKVLIYTEFLFNRVNYELKKTISKAFTAITIKRNVLDRGTKCKNTHTSVII